MRGFAFVVVLFLAAPNAMAQDMVSAQKLFRACKEVKAEPCKALALCKQAQAEIEPKRIVELNVLTRELSKACAETPAPSDLTEGPPLPPSRTKVPEGQVRISPGSFRMGSPSDEQWSLRNETPHPVRLSRPIAMQAKEVTQQQWRDVTGLPAPSYFQSCGLDCPVESVTWYEAVAFANALSTQDRLKPCYTTETGETYTMEAARLARPVVWPLGLDCLGWRLPTEAEWEYAARSTKDTATYRGELKVEKANDAALLNSIARYGGNSGVGYGGGYSCSALPLRQFSSENCGPRPGGEKQSNAFGLYDMLGNVWEWTWDTYTIEYDLTDFTDPTGPNGPKAEPRSEEPTSVEIVEGDKKEGEEEGAREATPPEGRSRGAVVPRPPPLAQEESGAPEVVEGGTPRSPGARVTRGCSWISNARHCRLAFRGHLDPAKRSFNQGFRLARTLP